MNRKHYIDYLRAGACFLVVLDHVVIVGYRFLYPEFNEMYNSFSLLNRLITSSLWIISRLGVPMFAIITGALLFDRDYSSKLCIKKFYTNNLIPLIVVTYIWMIVYWFVSYIYTALGVDYVYNGSTWDFSLREFIYQLLFIHRGNYANIWYLGMIIGMYLFLPFVSTGIKTVMKIETRFIVIPFVMSLMIFLPQMI